MRTRTPRLAFCALAALLPTAGGSPVVEFDHLIIGVAPGAPERAVFERAGFIVWPAVQRHEGQGTASVMIELDRSFIELAWRDSTVRLDTGLEGVPRKFALRSAWRSSGWSPFGFGLRRSGDARDSLPFSTWSASAAWMAPGTRIQIVTARTDSTSPNLWVVGRSSAADNAQAPPEARNHPNGARRITGLELTVPAGVPATEPLRVLEDQRVAAIWRGTEWLLIILLDSARKGRTEDLRPALPVIVKY
jgi:hypothetical protein